MAAKGRRKRKKQSERNEEEVEGATGSASPGVEASAAEDDLCEPAGRAQPRLSGQPLLAARGPATAVEC